MTGLLAHHNYLYESLTARENLVVTAGHLRRSPSSIDSLLEQVALGARGNDVVSTFSAGMRKRLSLARLLLQEPLVALLDEPYGTLDPPGFDLVDEIIGTLRRSGATIVMATHQWERASRICDLAIVLDEGRMHWQGPASEALAHEPRWVA
jgi:heme exporter protein A